MAGAIYVVCSFPRSGTHFLIDLLRLNFAELAYRPPLWASAETLYYNLDRELAGAGWKLQSLARDHLIVKTHCLPFEPRLQESLHTHAAGRPIRYLTPVRRLDRLLQSYRAYVAQGMEAEDFLTMPDPYYRVKIPVAEQVGRFYGWALENSCLLDVSRTSSHPEEALSRIGNVMGLTRKTSAAHLPPRRHTHGPLGEMIARLRGRPSSEVVVLGRQKRSGIAEGMVLTPELEALDRTLQERAL